jgi:transcriptional regulator with XRE-family HTH domain
MAKTNDAVKINKHRYIKGDPDRQELMREISLNAEVAQLIYTARKEAGLTQQQLADLIQTKQLVIARLEDNDYEGHSLTMLQRISEALGQKIEIKMVPTTAGTRNPSGWGIAPLVGIVKATSNMGRDRLACAKSENRCTLARIDYQFDLDMSAQIPN